MLDDARSAAQGKLEIEKAELDFEVALGKISNAQKYQQLQKYEADAYAAERQALLLKQGLYAQDEKEFARIGRQIQKLDDDFTKHQIDNARKETLAKLQSFQQFFRQIDQNVKTSLAGWLQGRRASARRCRSCGRTSDFHRRADRADRAELAEQAHLHACHLGHLPH
jgi:hypothetical protein